MAACSALPRALRLATSSLGTLHAVLLAWMAPGPLCTLHADLMPPLPAAACGALPFAAQLTPGPLCMLHADLMATLPALTAPMPALHTPRLKVRRVHCIAAPVPALDTPRLKVRRAHCIAASCTSLQACNGLRVTRGLHAANSLGGRLFCVSTLW